MNYLLAKIKRKIALLKVLSTNNEIYQLPDSIDNSNEYNSATLLDEAEWYRYSDFSGSEFCLDFLKSDFDSVNHDQISVTDFGKTAYFCALQGDKYYFQGVSTNIIVRKKWFSLDELSIQENKPIVTINIEPDVLYDKSTGILYFKKLSAANHIFRGMDQLYRQATDAETQSFLGSEFLEMRNGFNKDAVKIPNRKRIALVMDTLNGYNEQEKSEICEYIKHYSNIPFNNDKFEIETEVQLKNLLFGIEQRFYTTRLGNRKRLANSIIPLD